MTRHAQVIDRDLTPILDGCDDECRNRPIVLPTHGEECERSAWCLRGDLYWTHLKDEVVQHVRLPRIYGLRVGYLLADRCVCIRDLERSEQPEIRTRQVVGNIVQAGDWPADNSRTGCPVVSSTVALGFDLRSLSHSNSRR